MSFSKELQQMVELQQKVGDNCRRILENDVVMSKLSWREHELIRIGWANAFCSVPSYLEDTTVEEICDLLDRAEKLLKQKEKEV